MYSEELTTDIAPVGAKTVKVETTTIGLAQLLSATSDVVELKNRLNEYVSYCKANHVPIQRSLIDQLESVMSSAIAVAQARIQHERGLQADSELDRQTVECEQFARMMLQTKSYVIQCLEWCAPSYEQSSANQFFDLRAQRNTRVNYERYESKEVEAVEQQLAEVLGYDTTQTAVLLTSSGMAAYALVEAFAVRELLNPNDTVLVSPYIYFEASGQLTTLKSLDVVFADSYDVGQILAQAKACQPRVIFLDPLSNTPEQRLIDLDRFFREIGSAVNGPVAVVIDGTMSPGCYRHAWGTASDKVEIIYYESCSKYLQLGFDNVMAGYVLAPIAHREKLGVIRRNTGAILSRDCANTFPKYSAETLWKRMDILARNAMVVMHHFSGSAAVQSIVEVHYPGHPSHPDHEIGKRYKALGGCVSFKFRSGNDYPKLNRFISELIDVCTARGIRLIKGVSFGHTVPRVSASSAMAGFDKPYIRLFVGALGTESTLALCKAIELTLLEGSYLQSELTHALA
ncbi:PLP-dependent transferase [Ralstonia syzygii subsp. celebesensis]|uniref:PLP-dependent transferase n=3 Tax=Ralstonia solanacearum species complex TaxID=3116862 RepID=A0AAD0WIF4_RALSL|nr:MULTISPECIES: PLP-dependent transferase [Ralstonia solanacearum species complex]AQW32484.1 cystathionine gamma-synthase [blood disease bacterium A2-HR MARDI]AXV83811.1 PLP-dependent transferase [Ralstonia solanacearum]AXW54943.1 PLP-dependent transferase [Ralstonia solanacearum]CCA83484.1 putative cystathionine beta-lyases protein (metB) [blood disease bacterium R229]